MTRNHNHNRNRNCAPAALLALLPLLPLLALGPAGAGLAAPAVYRCGANRYADVPCPQARIVDVDDPRTDAQRAAAQEVASREAALAARLTAERERADAMAVSRPSSRPVKLVKAKVLASNTPPATRTRRGRLRSREDDEGNFIAYIPAPARGTAKQ